MEASELKLISFNSEIHSFQTRMRRFHRSLRKFFSKRYNVYLGNRTETITRKKRNNEVNDSSDTFHITAKNDTSERKIESDQLLVAVGRVPNSYSLDLQRTGVKVKRVLS
jgi:pyruvate/2-oxoglutarate dehydrogenase complex dihydrolipoamide dehydrogenase (E3) component